MAIRVPSWIAGTATRVRTVVSCVLRCGDHYLHRYQTLVAGILAIVGALIGAKALLQQTEIENATLTRVVAASLRAELQVVYEDWQQDSNLWSTYRNPGRHPQFSAVTWIEARWKPANTGIYDHNLAEIGRLPADVAMDVVMAYSRVKALDLQVSRLTSASHFGAVLTTEEPPGPSVPQIPDVNAQDGALREMDAHRVLSNRDTLGLPDISKAIRALDEFDD